MSVLVFDSEWANVEEDCKKALELDNTSVKVAKKVTLDGRSNSMIFLYSTVSYN